MTGYSAQASGWGDHSADTNTAEDTGVGNAPPVNWGEYFLQAEQTSLLVCADQQYSGMSGAYLSNIAFALGHRVLGTVSIDKATTQLSQLVDVDAVVVACSGSEPGIDGLLARLDMIATTQDTRVVVIVELSGLDAVHAIMLSSNAVILCEPSPDEVTIALSMLVRRARFPGQLSDISREADSNDFERLNDQLLRLNQTIEALVLNRAPDGFDMRQPGRMDRLRSPDRRYVPDGPSRNDAPVAAHHVRALLRARRLREHVIAPDLFADPAWDILLDLLAARLERARVSVSSLCIAAAVPPTTALRWIKQLTERGLLERQADPKDGRRIFIALSDEGTQVMLRWFQESRSHLAAAIENDDDMRDSGKILA